MKNVKRFTGHETFARHVHGCYCYFLQVSVVECGLGMAMECF